ncbi:nitrobindin family protein [Kineococcus sp. SYSU DK001]|uniref:FABP family protein n=1 Tax=Kineococcus sp. SYSU DK001 TaxID=3383122 RepID=UPI003D7DC2C0
MALPLRTDTPLTLVPLSWLIGRWEGAGVLGHPARGETDTRFGQVVEFTHDGRDFLSYTSTTWALDDDGNTTDPLDVETGYWRPQPVDLDSPAPADGPRPVELEVLLTHPTGVVEILAGTARGPRIDLSTDVVARTTTAHEYTAGTRMYGLVEGDLLWALDVTLEGHPLRSYASARLKRVAEG